MGLLPPRTRAEKQFWLWTRLSRDDVAIRGGASQLCCKAHFIDRGKAGANDGARTRDHRYHKPALYQLSYIRHTAGFDLNESGEQVQSLFAFFWREGEDWRPLRSGQHVRRQTHSALTVQLISEISGSSAISETMFFSTSISFDEVSRLKSISEWSAPSSRTVNLPTT